MPNLLPRWAETEEAVITHQGQRTLSKMKSEGGEIMDITPAQAEEIQEHKKVKEGKHYDD